MRGTQAITRKVAPMAVLGLFAALAIASCGGDDDSCDYLFADVPTQDDCGGGKNNPIPGSLQALYDCGNAVYTPATEGCQLISCAVCVDTDADFDGDVDDDL